MSIAEQITQTLRQRVLSHSPGEKLPSVRALMSRYGTSLHSVNRALRKLEEEGLITTKKGSGIFISPQKGVRYIELHRPNYPSITTDIKEASLGQAIAQMGWKMLVNKHPLHGEAMDAQPNPKACAHVVIPSIFEANPSFYGQLVRLAAPMLACGRVEGPFRLDWIAGDEPRYLSLLLKHLRDLGHQRLAILSNEPPTFSSTPRSEIFLEIADLIELPDPVVVECGTRPGESSFFKAYEGLKKYLDSVEGKPAFTALITASAAGVIGALRALHEAGLRVPEDCSVASLGIDPENTLLVPSITEVGIPEENWGQGVVEVLKQRFASPDAPPISHKLAPQLIVRESTTPPGQG